MPPTILSTDAIRNELSLSYSKDVLRSSRERRLHNIESFISLDRTGLTFNSSERRLWLFTTIEGEAVGIQYPGKESIESNEPKIYDFRPIVRLQDGSFIPDLTFGDIWDIFSEIGRDHQAYLCFLASFVYDMGYLQRYEHVNECYSSELISVTDGEESITEVTSTSLDWYKLSVNEDVWYTLNDRIGRIAVSDSQTISFEAFVKFMDLLWQNEDCKYYYKKAILYRNLSYATKLDSGRINSSGANLLILNYLEGHESLSSLINKIQKGRGVASFKKADYQIVTDGLVINIES